MNEKIKILIIGSGAIGSYYGANLAQAGALVATLCRSDYEIVKQKGIFIQSKGQEIHFMPDQVIRDINDYQGPADYLIITTKVLPHINIEKIIRPVLCPQTAIVLIQNGIDIEPPLRNAFPGHEIISGLAFICVTRTAPGQIHHQDYGSLVIGNYPQNSSEKCHLLAQLFTQSGINCTTSEQIIYDRWKKLVWNAPFNPISVIGGGINTQTMLQSEESIKLIKTVMQEVVFIAEKDGYQLPEDIIDLNINKTKKMTPYKTSMLLDYENKRAMEVEAILGRAVKKARNLNLSVPRLESLYALLLLIDQQNQK